MVDIIEGYETEEQQIDAIKRFLKKYGVFLIISAVIIIAGIGGWHYYQSVHKSSLEQASQTYSNLILKFQEKGINDERDEMQKFVTDNKNNTYGVLVSLLLAKEFVKQKEYKQAISQLIQLKSYNKYAPLDPVINLRLAKVQLAFGKFDDAIKTVGLITAPSFAVKANQIKGLIYLNKGDTVKAYYAFKLAVDKSRGNVDPILQMQLNDVTLPADKMHDTHLPQTK